MPRRAVKHPEKPHRMDPEIERKFKAYLDPKKQPKPLKPKWMLFRWDTLEDCPDLNE